ncbi:hypothetical protein [Candidatus Contendibacter odensensis]|uniref:DNA replication terminus site-binding protein n=1 Tax=Candidatus Contendobacter odensis Run_B_J11 TaxID=1400861 RepID=A0A7U7J5E1_9GAMM|nr:hypothetical protein [Candidatus Contendobacter odensis]MBK8754277.1 hypothetical protein [Candidatus Competibacteraceae bacterium]CDH47165.1 conserved hypothetical protein [Candidatus Contendobacter odensis Run_B_J11]
MQSLPVAARIDLLSSFEAVLAQVDKFCAKARQDTALPAWVSRTEAELTENLDMRFKAIQVYRALWYENSQDGRETLTCPGIVGASSDTLAAAHACNRAKDDFKTAVLTIKALGQVETKEAMVDLHRRWEIVAAAMRRMGAARLNLKQAYRHIPLLERCPIKIGFTWSKQGRVIQRTSVAAARRLLEQRAETPQIRLEMQRLAEISADELLARVRSVCPHLRANIVFADSENSGRVSRRLMQAPLPILVPLQANEQLPDFVAVASEPPASPRLRRADVRIEDELFLPSIRMHRYRDFCRSNNSIPM